MSLLALLVFITALCAAPAPRLDARAAWREACALSGYDCFWLTPPQVVRAPLAGLFGRYHIGDRYIVVDDRIPDSFAYAVQVHETVHYLQWKHGAWKFNHENTCQMEREAFNVSNAVLRRIGETGRIVDWDVTRHFYGCTS